MHWAAWPNVLALRRVVYGMTSNPTSLFCSLSVSHTALSFAAACDAMRPPSARILFAGNLATACRYHARGNTLYRIDLAHDAVLVDGFATYDRLCELEPRLSEIVFKDRDGSWRRRSVAETDYEVFTNLRDGMPAGEHGISFRGFKHFPDETILFDAVAVREIVRRDDSDCEEILRGRLEASARRPTLPMPKKKRRIQL